MNYGFMLACVSIVISALASIGYFAAGDLRHGIYWLSAAVLTASVTF